MRCVRLIFLIISIAFASCTVLPRQAAGDPPWQPIPSAAPKADNTFHTGTVELVTEPANSQDIGPAMYGARGIDIPFRRLHQGNLIYFKQGQLNTPDGITDEWAPGQNDFSSQSACGIPDSAYFISKVAIHPYFLKYAPDNLGLNRKQPCVKRDQTILGSQLSN